MPFGAAASGIAWHKIGHLLTLIGRKLLGLPLFRYVDDYFSTDRQEFCCGSAFDVLCTRVYHLLLNKRPETVEHGLDTFVRLVRAVLGQSAIADSKVECGMTLVILGILVLLYLYFCGCASPIMSACGS